MDTVLQVIDFFDKVLLEFLEFFYDIFLFIFDHVGHDVCVDGRGSLLHWLWLLLMVFGKILWIKKQFLEGFSSVLKQFYLWETWNSSIQAEQHKISFLHAGLRQIVVNNSSEW